MPRQPKIEPRINVRKVLWAAYGHFEVIDAATGDVLSKHLYWDPSEHPEYWDIDGDFDDDKYEIDREDSGKDGDCGYFPLSYHFEEIQQVIAQHKQEYEKIDLNWDTEYGYSGDFRLVGIRPETDEEYALRLDQIEKAKIAKEKKKLAKVEQVKANKLKLLEKLKKEFQAE